MLRRICLMDDIHNLLPPLREHCNCEVMAVQCIQSGFGSKDTMHLLGMLIGCERARPSCFDKPAQKLCSNVRRYGSNPCLCGGEGY
jgi:hypothetical protein